MPLNFSFAQALEELGEDAAFRIANETRPTNEYMFNIFLPEVTRYDYTIKAGHMVVRTTMAGLAAMDSPYPPGGMVDISTFMAEAAKLANHVVIPERTLRELQNMLMHLTAAGSPTRDTIQNEALNFLQKVIVQAHLDTMEWLRSQALVYGAIDWTFNKMNLTVDYGIPADNFLTTRTIASNEAYGGTASAFWTDVRLLRRRLRYNVRAFIAHPDTIDLILFNDVNSLEIIGQTGYNFTLRRLIGDNERAASDTRDTITIMGYDGEAEVLDPSNPGETVIVEFMPRGKILAIGENTRPGYRVGEGSTPDPVQDRALGYTHLAPTVEGGGVPGRWAELYVPEREPMKLAGRGVTNGLPVIEVPNKIAVATTEYT